MGVDEMKLNELYREKKPMYVGVKLDGNSLAELAKLNQGVENKVSKGEMHITVAYSRKPISLSALGALEPPASVKAKHYSIFKTQTGENCLVLEVESPTLTARHREIIDDYGASYDFPEYKPHITLSYDCGIGFDIKKLPPVDTIPELFANLEYAMELDLEWQPA